MHSTATIRQQIEKSLAHKIPSALTPVRKMIHPVAPTGVSAVDELLHGGLPIGAITEMVGPESSGRTAIALSFLNQQTRAGKVCAWVDVSNALAPESAAAAGIALSRILWVRCGVTRYVPNVPVTRQFTLPEKYLIPSPTQKGLHGGGCGGHPRRETKGMPYALTGLLHPENLAPRCAEPQRRIQKERITFAPQRQPDLPRAHVPASTGKPWTRIEQALRAIDLLLQAGGFSAIVLDMASIPPEHASRVPLATWFRYRAAAERTQTSLLLLTQYPCAKSSGELILRFQPAKAHQDEGRVFTGMECRLEVERRRFPQEPTNLVPLRKPPQAANAAHWKSRTTWAGAR